MPSSESGNNPGAIILAAGQSSRMGRAKQLLPWKGKTMLRHTIEQIRASGVKHLTVVLGSSAKEIEESEGLSDVRVVVNKNWELGMGSSLVFGMSKMLQFKPNIQSVLIAVSDQPLLEASYYSTLINKFLNSKYKIVSSSYSEQYGVPVIYDRIFFDDLLKLKGDQGAKHLLHKHSNQMVSVEAGTLAVDLDTLDKYNEYFDRYGSI